MVFARGRQLALAGVLDADRLDMVRVARDR